MPIVVVAAVVFALHSPPSAAARRVVHHDAGWDAGTGQLRQCPAGHHGRFRWVRETRTGIRGGTLWRFTRRVSYCTNRQRTKIVWVRMQTRHWENDVWGYAGLEWVTVHKYPAGARRVNWYKNAAEGHMRGYTPLPYVYDNDYPQVSLTVWADGTWDFGAKCGC